MGVRVSGFRGETWGFGFQGAGFSVQGLGFRVEIVGSRVKGKGSRCVWARSLSISHGAADTETTSRRNPALESRVGDRLGADPRNDRGFVRWARLYPWNIWTSHVPEGLSSWRPC